MEDMPDLSHLTPEERRHIESVIMRQRQEDEYQNEIMRRKQNEVQVLEDTISRARNERLQSAGRVDLDATCEICLKTKFADGVGHICNYCSVRCCARCGGKVSLRSNKVIWVCILCRKKQELLSKSGQWMMKSSLSGADGNMLRRMQEDMQGMSLPQGLLQVDPSQDKRPKLERAHSAVEKENLPLLQRSSSLLRRQYSHQEQIQGRRFSTSDSGVEMSVSPHSRTLPTPHVAAYQAQQPPRHPAAYPEDDPNLYRGELDGLMRQNSPYQQQRQRPMYQEQSLDMGMGYGHPPAPPPQMRTQLQQHLQHPQHPMAPSSHSLHPGHAHQHSQQRSFSSSEEERSTPECASDEPNDHHREHGKGYYQHGSQIYKQHGHDPGTMIEYNGHLTDSNSARKSFRRSGEADSRRVTERRGKKTVRFHGGTNDSTEEWSWEADRQGSQDSATKDSGIETSSTFTSSEDSNRGDLPKHPSPWQVSNDGTKLIGKMVLRKSSQGTLSSSSILGLKVIGGKLLEDGTMGALIEKVKKGSPADVEGQLRTGDEVLQWNGHSLQGKSFQDVSDIIAMSRSEPQVELVVARHLNAANAPPKSMTGPTQPSPGSPALTPMTSRRFNAQAQWRQKHDATLPSLPYHKELYDARGTKPSVLVTSPGSSDLYSKGRACSRQFRHPATGSTNSVGGRLQLKLSFDASSHQLVVTLVCASGLIPRPNGQSRSSYAKMYLLPDKSENSKRRTKTLANTNDPRWDQTFVYGGVRWSDLRQRSLEITIWDYGRYGTNDFLGEVLVNLTALSLNDEPEWHYLMAHEEHRQAGYYQDPSDDVTTPGDCHLSPPSTTSRLSDSDTSECDITDCDGSREHRRTADGASISSIGSSSRFHNMPPNYKRHYSSPPPEKELCVDGEHRSRRDMSPQGRKRAALMGLREQPASISGYQHYRKVNFRYYSEEPHRGAMLSHRSHSAAPMDSPMLHYRGRSQSPTGHRSLSPPDHRGMPYSPGYISARFASRSATATPTGSPKKRQLPQIPATLNATLKERVAQDFEERARYLRHRHRPLHSIYRGSIGAYRSEGWDRRYSGLSDSDLPSMGHEPHSLSHSHIHRMHRSRRGHISPEKDVLADFGDSDMESIASVTSSAFSTQSERPRGFRSMIPTVKNVYIPGVVSPMPPPPRRSRRKHRVLRVPCSECHCPSNLPCKPRSSNHPTYNSKHNHHHNHHLLPSHHNPLVRSKSAVVRSLCKRMRAPFTRSHTVDESVLRYYSPDTDEYTVTDAYLLKPETMPATSVGGGSGKRSSRSRSRIPEIYVEDCLSVRFNKRLIDKFRAKNRRYQDIRLASSGSSPPYENAGAASPSGGATLRGVRRPHRRSRSWHERGIAAASALPDTGRAALAASVPTSSSASLIRRRSPWLSIWSTATTPRHSDCYYPTTRQSSMRRSLLSSKARSFDYDDYMTPTTSSTETATPRRSRNGLLGLSGRSRSFECDNVFANIFSDDSLQTARQKIKKSMDLSDDGYGDKVPALGDQSKSYYDSNGDAKFTRQAKKLKSRQADLKSLMLDEDNDFDIYHQDQQVQRLMYGYDSELSCGETEIYLPRELDPRIDDAGGSKRKYRYSPERRPRSAIGVDNEAYDPDVNEHIYCSIDEVNQQAYRNEIAELSRWRRSSLDRTGEQPYANVRSRAGHRRRTKSNDSYLNYQEHALYDNWNAVDEGYYDDSYYDYVQRKYDDDYNRQSIRYAGGDEYPNIERSSSSLRHARAIGREAQIATEPHYENVPYFRPESRHQATMLPRAESTPILYSDEELRFDRDYVGAKGSRRRNTSCPESRDVDRYYEEQRSRYYDDIEERTRNVLQSDEETGSLETVVERNSRHVSRIDESRFYYDYEPYYHTHNRQEPEDVYQYRHRSRRKTTCPACQEEEQEEIMQMERRAWRYHQDDQLDQLGRQSRNSNCSEARALDGPVLRTSPSSRQQSQQQPQQQPAQKRNVAISDTLEYYEYSMESESQCSENCGFGPCDPRRPYERAPRPGNANSHLFDSQTASTTTATTTTTSDHTAKPSRTVTYDDHHYNHYHHHYRHDHHDRRDNPPPAAHHVQLRDGDYDNVVVDGRLRRRQSRSIMDDAADRPLTPRQQHDYNDDPSNNRRSSSMPERSDYQSHSSSYEKPSRYTDDTDRPSRESAAAKRGQFARSFSNADAPTDEKADGSLSDTAVGLHVEESERRARKSSPSSKSGSGSSSGGGSAVQYQSGMGKKSNSTSQLSAIVGRRVCAWRAKAVS
ncbi:uncharacterized protein LOC131670334 isoform X2 [Phymastichus coffea]|uniref:uncharacterized protein LOC131670334 isoform X2 n=1 Tax=Phymastichus coffea TaxID=108790 RepID=UPI00273B6251|nr:uncharacterized protein LOC131670334 isoform X2 [Phymastichus coffea]